MFVSWDESFFLSLLSLLFKSLDPPLMFCECVGITYCTLILGHCNTNSFLPGLDAKTVNAWISLQKEEEKKRRSSSVAQLQTAIC